jgi:diacylglycerol O-acyltransferase
MCRARAGAVRRELGVTVNDIVLSAISGGLRELLLERGRQPDAHALRTLLPVSSRAPGPAGHPGNEVTLMLSMLPVEHDDPVARVLAVHERVAGLRRAHEPEAGVVLQALAGLVPFPVLDRGLRWGLRLPQQQISTVTTNVPGPRTPLTCLGRPVRQHSRRRRPGIVGRRRLAVAARPGRVTPGDCQPPAATA